MKNVNWFIINKGEEDKLLCMYCFDDLWKEYSDDGWTGDDIEYYLELELEKEKELELQTENAK